MTRLAGKVAAVTGGAGGIGEATVRRFVEAGAKVVFADREQALGEALAKELTDAGGEVVFVPTHVEREESVQRFVQTAIDRFGALHSLVNNAGVRMYTKVTEATAASWEEILGVNLLGYVFASKAAIPQIEKSGGGNIVNIASIRSVVAGSKTVQYDTTKAAILGLTRSMARDHAAQAVRVNAVGPGPIFTRFHAQRAVDLGKTEAEYVETFGRDTLLKRPGTPREIANAVLFLASEEASFITGTCLYVDGGITAFAEQD